MSESNLEIMNQISGESGVGNVANTKNPWNRLGLSKSEHNGQQNNYESAEKRFQQAQTNMQASIQRHIQNKYDSSSDEEELESEPILKIAFKDYSKISESQDGLEKIYQFLENSFQSGAGVCLICICNIKRTDPIWNCLKCYGFFHLLCIQKWSHDSIFQQEQAQLDLPEFKKTSKINWPCPKCRHEYDKCNIPKRYYCFCGKTQDPPYQPFLVPHSCGEKCGKSLESNCGHFCLLLCHPGQCPPCPQTIQTWCHCKKEGPRIQRCATKFWSCGGKCGKLLLCKKHFCEDSCHESDCPPCNKFSIQKCNCGLQKRKQPCTMPEWQCEQICGKPFSCGFHNCIVVCHSGRCGNCPRSLIRTCPCGKTENVLPCDKEIPTCNGTCGKLLKCGMHYCSQKCHKGPCGMCFEMVMKACRCGQRKKELSCEKEFLCGSKCRRLRNCSRHPCSRKCCDLNCPPCEKQCGRTLPCGNHKCPAVCHKGPCYPCPEVVQIKCRCGNSVISVPCGREKKTKPPRCSKPCLIPPNCHHPSREAHQCHFGECPPCEQICGKDRKNCTHKCSAPCHSAVWQKFNENPSPAGPWEAAQFQMKRCNLPCPDCVVNVPVTCLGGHETVDKPCFKSLPTPCSRSCGRLLTCGNHKCEKLCHKVLGASDAIHAGENCSECDSECTKDRPEGCKHKCPSPCHPGDCPPCKVSQKMKCHCSVSILYNYCGDYFSGSDEKKKMLLSCGNPCPKTYSCGHSCRLKCHPGVCPEECNKKVKVRCRCGKYKKALPCESLRKENVKFVECADSCLSQSGGGIKVAEKPEMFEEKDIDPIDPNDDSFFPKYGVVLASALVMLIAAALFYITQH